MKALSRFALVCTLGAALAALTSACGSSDDPAPTGAAGAAAAGAPATAGAAGSASAGAPAALVGDATKGATLYANTILSCNSCHGANGQGELGPNITLSTTAGIGSWTYAQFHDAVRLAKDKDGTKLCAQMVAFEEKYASEQDIADIYAFLKSKPAVDTVQRGTYCP